MFVLSIRPLNLFLRLLYDNGKYRFLGLTNLEYIMDIFDISDDKIIKDQEAVVKWFNPVKGFGFVEIEGYKNDAFLHISVLSKTGHNSLYPATKIKCNIVESDRGVLVVNVNEIIIVDDTMKNEEVEGIIKFFNYSKGFGFVTPISGGEDIYLGRITLKLAGIKQVLPGQKVKVKTYIGSKGATAESISLI
ncbi:MAG: Cold shock protein CspA [Alphaproteobacteria bacterium ADurb.Bin438]|nr:MAG: Cold shock protein CspA [Alphaproteobacteria bacterium ADurb.Bin438]